MIPDPATEPTLTVERARELLGIARSTAYDAVRTGEIPSIRLGRKIVVPTAALLRMLHLCDVEPDGLDRCGAGRREPLSQVVAPRRRPVERTGQGGPSAA
jgi:excisionase family DNA binding protein